MQQLINAKIISLMKISDHVVASLSSWVWIPVMYGKTVETHSSIYV